MRMRANVISVLLPLVLTGCSQQVNQRVATRLNDDAAIVGLAANPMQGKVITSWIDKQSGTMSTLFGNDVAAGYARTSAEFRYPTGSVLSAVTWSQAEDPRWFGGSIPAKPQSVEIVTVGGTYSYRRFEGSPLKQVAQEDGAAPGERAAYLLSQRAAVMP
jgi:hypothetical protein